MWIGPRKSRCAIVLSAALVYLLGGTVSAGFIASTWQGPNGGKWSVAANWNSNRVPNNTAADTFGATINSGAVQLDINATVDQFTFAGDTISSALLDTLTVQKAATWTSGTLKMFNLTTNGTFAIGPAAMGKAPLTFDANLNTNGATTLSGGNVSVAGFGHQINNAGTFTIPDDSGMRLSDPKSYFSLGNGAKGSLIKSGGTGTSQVDAFARNEGGVIQVKSGTLSFASLSQSGGTTSVDKGATLVSTADFNIRGGQLTGLGTVQAPNVINGGKLKATLAQNAKLMIIGNLDESGAPADTVTTFDSAVGGPWSDPDYNSTVEVTGNTLLGGLLEVERWPGYIPPPDHEFDVLISDGSLTGSFENVSDGQRITTTDGFGSFLVHYESPGFENVVALTDFERNPAVPEPSALALLLSGAALLGVRRKMTRTSYTISPRRNR